MGKGELQDKVGVSPPAKLTAFHWQPVRMRKLVPSSTRRRSARWRPMCAAESSQFEKDSMRTHGSSGASNTVANGCLRLAAGSSVRFLSLLSSGIEPEMISGFRHALLALRHAKVWYVFEET
jgi:hypothetical protein